MPYKSVERPVIVQKIKPQNKCPTPKNVIIEYEKPKAVAIRQVIEEGVFRVDPATYQSSSNGEVRIVDRITDLPIENSRFLTQFDLDVTSSSRLSEHNNHHNHNNNHHTTSNLRPSSNAHIYSKLLNETSFTTNCTTNGPNFNELKKVNLSANINDSINSMNTNLNKTHLNNNNNTTNTNISFIDTNIYSSASNPNSSSIITNSYNYNPDQIEYETITTSVPETLAQKIIAEARAAGITSKQ